MQSSPREFLGFDALSWLTMLLVLATAVLAYFAWRQLRASANASKADHLRRRGEATIRAINEFVNEYSIQHAKLLKAARAKGITVRDLVNQHGHDAEVRRTIQEQLDALEVLACGARLKVYDVNIVYYMTRSVIRQLGDRTANLRAEFNEGRLDTRAAQPTAYEHVKWLLAQLEAKSSEGPIELDGTLTGID